MNTFRSFLGLEEYYHRVKQNRWYWILFILCRILLAYAFILAGLTKIFGERFAGGLSELHPMGAYLVALHHTGYYYTFIGYAQVVAGAFLLIPRLVLFGALIYLPIILNICILSWAVRFEGSMVTSPLMVLANLYILAWNYDKLRYVLPFNACSSKVSFKRPEKFDNKFPVLFFAGVITTMGMVIGFANKGFEVTPRNSLKDCKTQFQNPDLQEAGEMFCECVHTEGNPLGSCLDSFEENKNNILTKDMISKKISHYQQFKK